MKLSCSCFEFSEKWDKKLKRLIGAEVTEVSTYTVEIKLESDRFTVKSFIFWTKEVVVYDFYEIWTGNKDFAYGSLYSFNGECFPDHLRYSASKETLEKLFLLENKLRTPNEEKAYS